ncbi:hypothetical protein C922_05761 [Plasmodium inui San Antonio 1]|uniref:Uncharacterized protein n=1 Tax=Plasmodium inui San Antonio 1 TaxID=1237626 RepID=W7AF06_9APIC|nr:hypothetical protein C922_05761 [Plasmodium inui San Antonio 1]EUD63861.1 hypothetical protein C922_05761 [Plasmodium inui San Antonio 1]
MKMGLRACKVKRDKKRNDKPTKFGSTYVHRRGTDHPTPSRGRGKDATTPDHKEGGRLTGGGIVDIMLLL